MKTVPIETLHQLLEYDSETGQLLWKPRSVEFFKSEPECRRWNTRYANKLAFINKEKNGYLVGSIFHILYKAHRVVLAMHNGQWPEDQTDHINGCRTDNRIANLRAVTRSENGQNKRLQRRSKTGAHGVVWHNVTQKWMASITVNSKRIYLGVYSNKDDAIATRKAAEIEYGFHPNHGRAA